jgi:hypothetical protein
MHSVQNGLEQADTLSSLFNFTLEYVIRNLQEKQEQLELNQLVMLSCWVKT